MLIAVSTPLFVSKLAPYFKSEGASVCNQLALMAPCWGFFVAFTLHLQERR